MPKILSTGKQFLITLSPEIMKAMGWEKGTELLLSKVPGERSVFLEEISEKPTVKGKKEEIRASKKTRRPKINKKAQGSTELLILLGVGITILLIFIALNTDLLSISKTDIRYSQARSMLTELVDAADLAYKQGPGSRSKLRVVIPNAITRINISNTTLTVDFDGTTDTVHRNFPFVVKGFISPTKGAQIVTIESFDDAVYFFATDNTTLPGLSNLDNTSQGTTWIYWTWTNPTENDFNRVALYLNGELKVETAKEFHNFTGLLSNTSYSLDTQTIDSTGNVNSTNVSHTTWTQVATTFTPVVVSMQTRSCVAHSNENKSLFAQVCDGFYPEGCGANRDLIGCNDSFKETHTASNIDNNRTYGGFRTGVVNTSVLDCYNISQVDVCFDWWRDDGLQDCEIEVDADGGKNYTVMSTTCPGTSSAGVSCTDVTALENWVCSNFFGAAGTRAKLQAQAQRSGGPGTTIISWDAFYYNVTYNQI